MDELVLTKISILKSYMKLVQDRGIKVTDESWSKVIGVLEDVIEDYHYYKSAAMEFGED